jgi:hypothetical protein
MAIKARAAPKRKGKIVLRGGEAPSFFIPPPLLAKERGIKGVRLHQRY